MVIEVELVTKWVEAVRLCSLERLARRQGTREVTPKGV
jgi:hypothetical protein